MNCRLLCSGMKWMSKNTEQCYWGIWDGNSVQAFKELPYGNMAPCCLLVGSGRQSHLEKQLRFGRCWWWQHRYCRSKGEDSEIWEEERGQEVKLIPWSNRRQGLMLWNAKYCQFSEVNLGYGKICWTRVIGNNKLEHPFSIFKTKSGFVQIDSNPVISLLTLFAAGKGKLLSFYLLFSDLLHCQILTTLRLSVSNSLLSICFIFTKTRSSEFG